MKQFSMVAGKMKERSQVVCLLLYISRNTNPNWIEANNNNSGRLGNPVKFSPPFATDSSNTENTWMVLSFDDIDDINVFW